MKGIDVAAKYQDIRRITLKHFSVPGVHPDDLVQEVALGILQRNATAGSAFDPARGSFSHYVYQVGQNIAARAAKREGKQARVRAALREELLPASGQRSKVGADTTPVPVPRFDTEATWAAALDGCVIQLSLFGWEPIEIATVRRAPRKARSARALVANPAQLDLFARAA